MARYLRGEVTAEVLAHINRRISLPKNWMRPTVTLSTVFVAVSCLVAGEKRNERLLMAHNMIL
jgi:hypothetical protein